MGSYYDIDAILTDAQVHASNPTQSVSERNPLTSAQKIPCTFDITVPGLGYMEGNPGGDVRLEGEHARATSKGALTCR